MLTPLLALFLTIVASARASVPYATCGEVSIQPSGLLRERDAAPFQWSVPPRQEPRGIPVTSPARRLKATRWTRQARDAFELGDDAALSRAARQAWEIAPDVEVLRSNHCHALYRQGVSALQGGRPAQAQEIAQEADGVGCAELSRDLSILMGAAARQRVRALYATPDPSIPGQAVDLLRQARSFARERGGSPPFLECDLSAALLILGAAELARKMPSQAADAFTAAGELVTGNPAQQIGLAGALAELGLEKLTLRDPIGAIIVLDQALAIAERHPEAIDRAFLVQALVAALVAQAEEQLLAHDLDGAVQSLERARSLDPSPATRSAFERLLFARSAVYHRDGQLEGARADLEQARRSSSPNKRAIEQRLALLDSQAARLDAINNARPFLLIPKVEQEILLDEDGDGWVDQLAWQRRGAAQAALFSARISKGKPYKAAMTTLLQPEVTPGRAAIYRDLDGDSRYDETSYFDNKQLVWVITDTDGDGAPDVERRCEPSGACSKRSLSGNMLIVVNSGVVGCSADVFSDADAFVRIRYASNHRSSNPWILTGYSSSPPSTNAPLDTLFQSSIDWDTNFPIWNEGVAVHYVYQDRLSIELWDHDKMTPHDYFGEHTINQLPEAGRHVKNIGRCASVEIEVTPTDLPHGYRVAEGSKLRDNVFRDRPWEVPEARRLVAGAQSAHQTAEISRWVAGIVISEALTHPLARAAKLGPVQSLLAGELLDAFILDPILQDALWAEILGL